MKRTVLFFLFTGILLAAMAGCAPAAAPAPTATPIPPTATVVPPTPTLSPQDAIAKLHWFGTASFLYKGSKTIYFDPVTLDGNLPPADLVLVTHGHPDHWSVADLKKIIVPTTKLIIGPNVSAIYEAAKNDLGIPATVFNEGMKTEVDGIGIEAVPAYGASFHLKGSGGVGYLVRVDGLTFYHAGGTDAYPEMANYAADIAFIPVYSTALAQAMAEIVPAKIIILEHTSFYGAQAVGTVISQNIGQGKSLVALEPGPYTP